MKTKSKKVKVHALRHKGLKNQLLSAHEIVNKMEPVLIMKAEARLMNGNAHKKWLKKRSTKIAGKVKRTYVVHNLTNKTKAWACPAVDKGEQRTTQGADTINEKRKRQIDKQYDKEIIAAKRKLTARAVVPAVAPIPAQKKVDRDEGDEHEGKTSEQKQKAHECT